MRRAALPISAQPLVILTASATGACLSSASAQRPRSFAAGEGGDDSALGGGKAKQKATRALPFPRSFTYGTSARDVMKEMTMEQQAAVSTLIDSMNAPQPAAAAAVAPQYDEEVLEYATYFGIDPQKEPHLMWIAEEGMDPPLPVRTFSLASAAAYTS